jgi:hypothetical protein
MRCSTLFTVFVVSAVGAFTAGASAAQRSGAAASQAASQNVTLTGCVEYGAGNSYVLATMDAPKATDLSNEAALERAAVRNAVHSYELAPSPSQNFSQMVGAKVRLQGTLSHETRAAAPARGRGPAAPLTVDEVHVSSVQKLADQCDARLTMFAL